MINSPAINFVDTSVFCNMVPVYGLDQDRDEVMRVLESKVAGGETLILPVTTVIETGNHIRHISDGKIRKTTAERFSAYLNATLNDDAPWLLNQYTWGPDMLRAIIAGASTGMDFVQHAVSGVGCGDLCIICERDSYARRSQKSNVKIWTIDSALQSHS